LFLSGNFWRPGSGNATAPGDAGVVADAATHDSGSGPGPDAGIAPRDSGPRSDVAARGDVVGAEPPSPPQMGCGCRAGTSGRDRLAGFLIVVVAAALAARRRARG
jgi:MYXO-CTERM domain-containing protein